MTDLRRIASVGAAIALMVLVSGCHRNRASSMRTAQEAATEQAMLEQASSRVESGDYDEALGLFYRILEENPTSGEAYLGIGDVYLDQHDYERAEPALSRAAKLEPRNYLAQYRHGLSLQMLDRFLEAIQAYHRALTIDPDSIETNRNLAASYLRLDEPRHAVLFAKRATQLSPDDGPSWINLGAAYEGMEDWKQAADAYVTASEHMEASPELMGNLLRMLVRQKRYREVITTADTIHRFGPDAQAWERTGWAWFRLGEYTKSLKAYQHAVEVDPNLWQAWNGIGVNQLNAWLLNNRQDQSAFVQAGSSFRASLRVNGDQPKVLDLMLKYHL